MTKPDDLLVHYCLKCGLDRTSTLDFSPCLRCGSQLTQMRMRRRYRLSEDDRNFLRTQKIDPGTD